MTKGHYIHCHWWKTHQCNCRMITFRYWLSDKLGDWSKKVRP